jgi:CheY-like chemotaxis protein
MPKKILFIEDHQGLRSLANQVFSAAGYEVTEAPNGQAGLTSAIQGGFDAIVCDLKMPIMDGMTFLVALQQHQPAPANGPIIIYSNFIYEYAKDEAMRRGATAFIAKDTLGTGELVAEVEKIIAEHNTAKETNA